MIPPSSFTPFPTFPPVFFLAKFSSFVLSYAVYPFLLIIILFLNSLLFPFLTVSFLIISSLASFIISSFTFFLYIFSYFLFYPFIIHHILPCPVLHSLHFLFFPVHLPHSYPPQSLSPFLLTSTFTFPALYQFPCLYLLFPGFLSNSFSFNRLSFLPFLVSFPMAGLTF